MLTEAQLRAYIPALHRHASQYARQVSERDDLVQDAAMRIWIKRGMFEGDESDARGWMYAVAKSAFLDRKRKEKREPSQTPLFFGAEGDDNDESASDRNAVTLAVPPRAIEIIETKRVLKAVSEHKWGDHILHVVGDESATYETGAAKFGLKVGTFRTRLSRAREDLRGVA